MLPLRYWGFVKVIPTLQSSSIAATHRGTAWLSTLGVAWFFYLCNLPYLLVQNDYKSIRRWAILGLRSSSQHACVFTITVRAWCTSHPFQDPLHLRQCMATGGGAHHSACPLAAHQPAGLLTGSRLPRRLHTSLLVAMPQPSRATRMHNRQSRYSPQVGIHNWVLQQACVLTTHALSV